MNLKKPKNTFVLEDRIIKIVEFLSKGYTSKDIAKKGNIGVKSVEKIILQTRNHYKSENTTHLVATFLRKNIIK